MTKTNFFVYYICNKIFYLNLLSLEKILNITNKIQLGLPEAKKQLDQPFMPYARMSYPMLCSHLHTWGVRSAIVQK